MRVGSSLVPVIAVSFAAAAQPIQFPGNGHYYEVVQEPGGINWPDAHAAASELSFLDTQGHLGTVTSPEESDFLIEQFDVMLIQKWLGGVQDPEGVEPDGGWTWITGEEWSWTNWAPGEPNEYGGEPEDALHFKWTDTGAPLGTWNDLDPERTQWGGRIMDGYLVEYPVPDDCPADFNGDGVLNILDFVAFQLAWQAQDPAADCDASGEFNVLDFVCFQQLFQAGCP